MKKSKYPYGRDPKRDPVGFERIPKDARLPESKSNVIVGNRKKHPGRSQPDFPHGH